MHEETIHGKKCIIGDGEDTTFNLLKLFYPTAEFDRQLPIENFVTSDIFEFYNDIYKKATIDIGMWYMGHNFVIRVQGKNHKGDIIATKDRIQKKDMEDNGNDVIDILFQECPNIFKERLNWDSIIEFCNIMKMAGVPLGN